jgi:hypothetical protein
MRMSLRDCRDDAEDTASTRLWLSYSKGQFTARVSNEAVVDYVTPAHQTKEGKHNA